MSALCDLDNLGGECVLEIESVQAVQILEWAIKIEFVHLATGRQTMPPNRAAAVLEQEPECLDAFSLAEHVSPRVAAFAQNCKQQVHQICTDPWMRFVAHVICPDVDAIKNDLHHPFSEQQRRALALEWIIAVHKSICLFLGNTIIALCPLQELLHGFDAEVLLWVGQNETHPGGDILALKRIGGGLGVGRLGLGAELCKLNDARTHLLFQRLGGVFKVEFQNQLDDGVDACLEPVFKRERQTQDPEQQVEPILDNNHTCNRARKLCAHFCGVKILQQAIKGLAQPLIVLLEREIDIVRMHHALEHRRCLVERNQCVNRASHVVGCLNFKKILHLGL
eukprot:comp14116_c0_seq1/m.20076 comp14116_c0_seq1/g.20076  ORF comp14116_c0_seq1/g.20076 comp14116_c0_seq1/m.20076 type:complete len:337 (-) comp14116_c0_seq1:531-1541(-)